MGYYRAGFDVVGVDHSLQSGYPFPFVEADVFEVDLDSWGGVVVVAASPPCQSFTSYRRRGGGVGDGYVNLIPETRELLERTGLPYVIENVEAAREHLLDPVMLCGSSFGLNVRRHRLFESNVDLVGPACDHGWQTPRFHPATNRSNLRSTVEVGAGRIPLRVQSEAMGIDWMKRRELSLAIPPAYTECLGLQLLARL